MMINPLRVRLFDYQDGKCHWCDCSLSMAKPHPRAPTPRKLATIDHVFPRSDPRRAIPVDPNGIEHRVLACFVCNQERGDLPYDVFLLLKRPEWRQVLEFAA